MMLGGVLFQTEVIGGYQSNDVTIVGATKIEDIQQLIWIEDADWGGLSEKDRIEEIVIAKGPPGRGSSQFLGPSNQTFFW